MIRFGLFYCQLAISRVPLSLWARRAAGLLSEQHLLDLMGPIIGMSPDKKTEIPGMQEERTGLRGVCGVGTLPEAECASSPLATSVDRTGGTEDEELTNLNWLHENLLQNFTLGGPEAQASGGPLFDIEGDYKSSQGASSSSSPSSHARGRERDSLKSKPPFSFSLLIYMAIEQSPSKSLPVKEIYGWILEHFPYFSNAPTGWKNSVRHNLSLNKCFRKVDRSLGKASGKGSLWCVDPEYRPNLIQALKKQHFPAAHAFSTPPASPPSASSPPRHLFLQGCSFKGNSDGPLDLSRPDSVLVSSDPKQDHNYSSVALQRCSSRSSSSSLSSLDEGGCNGGQSRRAGSEGFHSDEDSDLWEERGLHETSQRPPAIKWPINKRSRREVKPEVDEELKEAAGSLLHLAGIRSCTEGTKHTVKSTKFNRK
ncbi:forkhead box protein N2 isoform X2 [Takifugu flavidus]|uniref:forkhead box protein N2 isoform X2 n=1 Tax=Takifugu flavidus TaxID=433684 RepID=UPI0025440F84|nr:forkhead box protein N2 isoform X2 [Takifugu flavidus]